MRFKITTITLLASVLSRAEIPNTFGQGISTTEEKNAFITALGGTAAGKALFQAVDAAAQRAALGVEPALGNPGTNGYLLSSTTGGTRSWVAPPSSATWGSITGTLSSQTDLAAALDGKESTTIDFYDDFSLWTNGQQMLTGTTASTGTTMPLVGGQRYRTSRNGGSIAGTAAGANFYAETSTYPQFNFATGLRMADESLGYFGAPFTPSASGKITMAFDIAIEPSKYYPGKSLRGVTMTLANPCVVSWAGHGLKNGFDMKFTTEGVLPASVVAGTTYYISNVTTNTFTLSTNRSAALTGTSLVSTASQSQSGTHIATFPQPVAPNDFTFAMSPSQVLYDSGSQGITLPLHMSHIRMSPGGVSQYGINTSAGSASFRGVSNSNDLVASSWLGGNSANGSLTFGRHLLIIEKEDDVARLSMGGRTLVFDDPDISSSIGGHWFFEFAGDSFEGVPFAQVIKVLRVWSSSSLNKTPGYGVASLGVQRLLSAQPVIPGKLDVYNNYPTLDTGSTSYPPSVKTKGDFYTSFGNFVAQPFQGHPTKTNSFSGVSLLSLHGKKLDAANSWNGTPGSTIRSIPGYPSDTVGSEYKYVLRGNFPNSNAKELALDQAGPGRVFTTGSITASGRWELEITIFKNNVNNSNFYTRFTANGIPPIVSVFNDWRAGETGFSLVGVSGVSAGDITVDYQSVTADIQRW